MSDIAVIWLQTVFGFPTRFRCAMTVYYTEYKR
jgi:hypothetical protein